MSGEVGVKAEDSDRAASGHVDRVRALLITEGWHPSDLIAYGCGCVEYVNEGGFAGLVFGCGALQRSWAANTSEPVGCLWWEPCCKPVLKKRGMKKPYGPEDLIQ